MHPLFSTTLFVFAIIYPAFVSRIAIHRALKLPTQLVDYYGGFLSGVGIACLIIGAVSLIRSRSSQRAFSVIIGCILVVFYYANFEHVIELDGAISFLQAHFLGDREFLEGSILQVGHPSVLATLFLSPLALFFIFRRNSFRIRRPHQIGIFSLALLSLGVSHLLFTSSTRTWRILDPIHENIISLLYSVVPYQETVAINKPETNSAAFSAKSLFSEEEQREVDALFRFDDHGTRVAKKRDGKNPNILLVMIEGLGGSNLPEFAGEWLDTTIQMDQFGKFAKKNGVLYKNFIYNSKKTNQGEYALLCGDYPNIATNDAKMDVQGADQYPKPCLAHKLRDAGYETVYLQSANLTFMNKDRFMPKAGFDIFLGFPYFKYSYSRNGWGVDDKTLFEHANQLIAELEKKEKPWFLALLNTGTHHPGLPPNQWEEEPRFQKKERITAAFQYADELLTNFLVTQKKNGLLDNSVVIVAGDEAKAIHRGSETKQKVSLHWGAMSIFAPGFKPGVNTSLHTQSDLAASILDYLELDAANDFYGRSFFRSYDRPRSLPFGVHYSNTIWLYREGERLTSCRMPKMNCYAKQVTEKLLFHDDFTPDTPGADLDRRILELFLSRNERLVADANAESEQFSPDSIHEVNGHTGKQRLLSMGFGKYRKGQIFSLAMEVEVVEGEAKLHPLVKLSQDGKSFEAEWEYSPQHVDSSKKMILDVSYKIPRDLDEILVILDATSWTPTSKLKVTRSKVSVSPPQNTIAQGVLRNRYSVINSTQ